ncbi:hypothetical protein pb186bvf_020161 [Paramecium bursaria]
MSDQLYEKLSNYGGRSESLDYSYNMKFQSDPSFEFDTTQNETRDNQDPKQEIRFLLSIIDQLQQDLIIVQKENEVLRLKYQDLYVIVQRQDYDKNLYQEIQLLQKQIQDYETKNFEQKRELEGLKANASELLTQNEGLYSLLTSLKEKHQFEMESLQKHQELLSQKKIDEEITLIQRQLKREIDTLNSICDQYKKRTEDLQSDNEIKSKKIQSLSDSKLKQDTEIQIMQGKLDRYKNIEREIADKENLLQQKTRLVQQLLQENNGLGEELKQTKDQMIILERNLKSLSANFELERQELQRRIDNLSKKEEEICKANSEFKKQEIDNSRILRQLQELGQENIRLLEQNTFILDKSNDTESLRQNYNTMVKKYQKLQQEYEKAVGYTHSLGTSVTILQQQLKMAQTEKNDVIGNLHFTQQQLLLLQQHIVQHVGI